MQVSFIVPVYNVAMYLDRCMASLYDQGLKKGEYEIILVNDGSTDSSYDICHRYASDDSSVILLNQKNQGVASARNNGLQKASGDFVCFVDPDDYLSSGGIGYLFSHFDLSSFNLIRFWMKVSRESGVSDNDTRIDGADINFQGCSEDYISLFGIDNFCVSFLYDRKWLNSTGIRFSDHLIAEDYLFIVKLLLCRPMIISTTARIYNYVKRDSSATTLRSAFHSRRCVKACMQVFEEMMDYASEIRVTDKVRLSLLYSAQDRLRLLMSRVLTSDLSYREFRDVIQSLRQMDILPINGNYHNQIDFSIKKGIGFLSSCPFLLLPSRFIYKHFFIPVCLPRLLK